MPKSCDGTNGWYARQTLTTPDQQPQVRLHKYVSEDEFTCKDPRFGNPLIPGLGIKYQAEVDYGFVNSPFAFTRIYRSDRGWVDSATGLRLVSYVGDVPDLSICTPGTYERKVSPTGPLQKVPYCFPLIGVSLTEYDLQTNDGRLIRFSGSTPLPKADVNSRLQQRLVNGVTQWFLFDEMNRLTIYGASGLPITTVAADGRSVSYAFVGGPAAGAKVLSTVTEWTGRQLVFSHDASRRVLSMRTPDGRYFSYAYDGTTSNCSPAGLCSNLTSVTYPDNTVRKFHYNESQFTANTNVPRLLTGISDETASPLCNLQLRHVQPRRGHAVRGRGQRLRDDFEYRMGPRHGSTRLASDDEFYQYANGAKDDLSVSARRRGLRSSIFDYHLRR